jgi:NAD kinase
MDRLTENKIVLVTRETRLDELKARFNTVDQARFYVESLGADFHDYENEHAVYRSAVGDAESILGALGRVQTLPRTFLPNFLFGPQDLVVALGQDGLVANTVKYLSGQPLIGVNPDPGRFDGQLLPFAVKDLGHVVVETFVGKRPVKTVTMAQVRLNNGQSLFAVNDLFIGPKSHASARYLIRHGQASERQSSSGVIVSTGLGSTGWFTSLITGARGVARAQGAGGRPDRPEAAAAIPFPWDADYLCFTVREPFPSKTTSANLVFGHVTASSPLLIESHMPERGVIFSDGIESDFLEFTSGSKAEIRVAERTGHLVA